MYKIKQKPEDFVVEEIPLYDFKDKGRYQYFLLEKRNYTTEKALRKLSRVFNIPRKKFGHAGNKDKKAITKQYCSVKSSISNKDLGDIKVKTIGCGNEPISLGDHKGNKFTITVRDVKIQPEITDNVINYFDEQRFSRNNVDVGLAIIKSDYKNAAKIIEHRRVKEHLEKNPNDYVGALKKIPFKILTLYVHSVQSWLWNEAAAKHIRNNCSEYKSVKYSLGTFLFPEGIEDIGLPLISFDTQNSEIYKEKLNELNLKLRDFVIRAIPDITPMGSQRKLVAPVKNMKISQLQENKLVVEFILDKGSYATIVLKKIL